MLLNFKLRVEKLTFKSNNIFSIYIYIYIYIISNGRVFHNVGTVIEKAV